MKKILIILIGIFILFSCDEHKKNDSYYEDFLLKQKFKENTLYVNKRVINVRNLPTTKSEIIGKLKLNNKVSHLKNKGGESIDSLGWYKVRIIKTDDVGWILSTLLSDNYVKSKKELESEKYMNKYSGVYLISPVTSYTNEGFGLKSGGYATWYWFSGETVTSKYVGSWKASKNKMVITVRGKSGDIPETFIYRNGRFRSTDDPSGRRYLIRQ